MQDDNSRISPSEFVRHDSDMVNLRSPKVALESNEELLKSMGLSGAARQPSVSDWKHDISALTKSTLDYNVKVGVYNGKV